MDLTNSDLLYQEYNTEYAYKIYKEIISELIAYIEVYEHDLPAEIMAQIAEFFQIIALYETSAPSDNISNVLYQTSLRITQSLYKHAICVFIKKIQEYKKIFKRFRYKGVIYDNQNFAKTAKERESSIVRSFSQKLRICYRKNMFITLKSLSIKEKIYFFTGFIKVFMVPSFITLKKEPYLPINNLSIECIDDVNLADIYQCTKKLLEIYEKLRPQVMSNGAEKSIGMKIFTVVCSWLIPLILAVPVAIKVIDILKSCLIHK